MTDEIFEDQTDCLTAIARGAIGALPENWSHAGIDIVRHSSREMDYRGYYLLAGSPERRSLDVPDEILDYCEQLAHLTSTQEKGLYRKLRFTLGRSADGAPKYHAQFDYDDTSEGFIGSNGVLIEPDFFEKPGPPVDI